jgi:hypothetical protein
VLIDKEVGEEQEIFIIIFQKKMVSPFTQELKISMLNLATLPG